MGRQVARGYVWTPHLCARRYLASVCASCSAAAGVSFWRREEIDKKKGARTNVPASAARARRPWIVNALTARSSSSIAALQLSILEAGLLVLLFSFVVFIVLTVFIAVAFRLGVAPRIRPLDFSVPRTHARKHTCTHTRTHARPNRPTRYWLRSGTLMYFSDIYLLFI